MGDAQLVQARRLLLQLGAVLAGEGDMVQTGAMLVETLTCGLGVCVQPEQLPSAEDEDGVVEAGRLVLVEDGRRREQFAVPAGASLEIGHCYSDMGDGWKVRHSSLLIEPGRADMNVQTWTVGILVPPTMPLRSARSGADTPTTAASPVRFRPPSCRTGTWARPCATIACRAHGIGHRRSESRPGIRCHSSVEHSALARQGGGERGRGLTEA